MTYLQYLSHDIPHTWQGRMYSVWQLLPLGVHNHPDVHHLSPDTPQNIK
jgi:hypothetical protein